MKKFLTVTAVLIVIAAVLLLLVHAAKYSGKAYGLAMDLKKAGLPIESVQITGSSAMYDEAVAAGGGLSIKINHFGNGLFMESIVKNLEEGVKNRDRESRPPIYLSGLYIVVVYAEPVRGGVKAALINKFGEVKEY